MDPVSRAQNSDNSPKKQFGKPFQKGQSGNPGGRPKRKYITEIYEEIFSDPNVREKVKAQMIKTMTSKGMAGVLERREGGDRTEGKVAQEVAVNGSLNISLAETIQERRKRRASGNR